MVEINRQLVLDRVCFSYKNRTVLDKLNLVASQGQPINITGESGSGKTTLLRVIGMLVTPKSGVISFNHQKCFEDGQFLVNPIAFRRLVGFVFQQPLLAPNLTVIENTVLHRASSHLERTVLKKRAKDLLYNFGIDHLCDKYPSDISGGEAQRTAIVRALIANPAILLLDEFTSALDSSNATTVIAKLLEILSEPNSPVVINMTHSLSVVRALGGRHFELRGGTLTEASND